MTARTPADYPLPKRMTLDCRYTDQKPNSLRTA